MNSFVKSGKVDDDCNCPKASGDVKVSLYLLKDNMLTESKQTNVIDALVSVLGYTEKQAQTAIGFANSRGECILRTGRSTELMKLLETLIVYGVKCTARSEGFIK